MKRRILAVVFVIVLAVSVLTVGLPAHASAAILNVPPMPAVSNNGVYNASGSAPPIDPNDVLTAIQSKSFTWINAGEVDVSVGATTYHFVDSKVMNCGSPWDIFGVCGNNGELKIQDYGCNQGSGGTINFKFPSQNSNSTNPNAGLLDLDIVPPNNIGNRCFNLGNPGDTINIGLSNPNNAKIFYNLSSDGTSITSIDGKHTFTQTPQDTSIFAESNAGCPNVILTNNGTMQLYHMAATGGVAPPAEIAKIEGACQTVGLNSFVGSYGVVAGISYPLGLDTTNGGITGGNGANGTNNSPSFKCSVTFKNPLTWLVCPVLDGIQDIMNQVGKIIGDFLIVPGKYFDRGTAQGSAIFDAWDSMRNIALAILGITALIMVLSQTLSFGPFDAYTVKKLLPRILVAAILITLSWSLVQLMVAVSNGLGDSVRSLIFQPFAHIGDPTFNSQTLGLGLVGGLGAISVLSIFGVLSLGLTAALALMVGLAVIVIRQILVILLAILAPVAIVCYILPGTDKAWKLWWDSFSGVLLMFPIIEAFIAAGQVFSKIASTNTTGGQTINQIIAFLALYIPYFLLPAAVRLAGGVISTIGGVVNDRSKGGFDRLKNFRKKESAKNVKALRQGDRWHGQSWIPGSRTLANRANLVTKGAATGWQGHFGIGERGRQRVNSMSQAYADEYLKEHPELQGTLIRQDDTAAVLGLSGGTSAGAARAATRLQNHWADQEQEKARAKGITLSRSDALANTNDRTKRALESARSLGINDMSANAALTMMAQNKSRAIGAGNYEMIDEGINALSHGNTQLAQDLAYNYQYNSRQAGRQDLGGAWTSASIEKRNDDLAHGRGTLTAAQVQSANRREVFMDAVKRGDSRNLVSGHDSTSKQAKNVILEDFVSGDKQRMLESSVVLAEMQGNLSQATGGNRDQILETFQQLGIDPSYQAKTFLQS